MPGLTIGKLAAAEGISVETVRFYQRRGLLALPERRGSGFREYSEAGQWRLSFIRRARKLGFTLGEIADLLVPAEARSTGDIVQAAVSKLDAIEQQVAELTLLRCRLRRPVIVEYWAQWCPPCRQVAPVLDAIASEHADKVDVVKINIDENPRTVQKYGIMLVPTLNVFSAGEVIKQVVGAKSKSALLREFADLI
ncbi:MAG: thioredoxin domain-containing protein [Micromonosporaceae bacterium]